MDYTKWDEQQTFTVCEAVALWCEENPAVYRIESNRKVLKIFRIDFHDVTECIQDMLKAVVEAEKNQHISINVPWKTIKSSLATSVISEAWRDWTQAEVGRSQLEAWAKWREENPKFLFPEARGDDGGDTYQSNRKRRPPAARLESDWKKRAQNLRGENPDVSDRQIAKIIQNEEIGHGYSLETIRKHLKSTNNQ